MIHYKEYDNYDLYLKDQVQKIKEQEDQVRAKGDRQFNDFLSYFAKFKPLVSGRVLCLGARFGAEVRAFRELGFDAIGLDLLGDEGDLVVGGDWNKMPFKENEFDTIYTNSIDHASDIKTEIGEVKRVLKCGGTLILDLLPKHAGDYKQIRMKFSDNRRYESCLWNDDKDVYDMFTSSGFIMKEKMLNHQWHSYILRYILNG